MKCQHIERWISDSVDGTIPKKKKAKIEAHLQICPGCRAFRDQIAVIDQEAKNWAAGDMSPELSQDFSSRLKSTLIETAEGKSKGILHAFRKKWVFFPASVIMISLFILIFVFYDRGDFQEEELYVFSFGDAVEEIYRDMGNDLALQKAFHSLVSATLNEMLTPPAWDDVLGWEDDPFFWDAITEEDSGVLEKKIEKENNS